MATKTAKKPAAKKPAAKKTAAKKTAAKKTAAKKAAQPTSVPTTEPTNQPDAVQSASNKTPPGKQVSLHEANLRYRADDKAARESTDALAGAVVEAAAKHIRGTKPLRRPEG